MGRHHTVGHAKQWVEPELDADGNEVKAGSFITAWQEDIAFTRKEEVARDAEEARHMADMVVRDNKIAAREALQAKLMDDTITFEELKQLLRG